MAQDQEVTAVTDIKAKEGRRFDRFYLLDEGAWCLKLNSTTCVSAVIQDLNSIGMQVTLQHHRNLELGELVEVRLSLYGDEFIACRAQIRWVLGDLKQPKIQTIGLQFVDPYYRIAKSWQERQIKFHVGKHRPSEVPDLELVEPVTLIRRRSA